MGCLFCQIIARDVSAHVVLDNSDVFGFLDNRPLFRGHVLLSPRHHIETLTDLPDELLAPLFGAARQVARAATTALDAQGSFVAMNNVVSQSVPHLHVHVVPRTKGDGLRGFFWPRTKYDDEDQAADVAERLRHALSDLNSGGS